LDTYTPAARPSAQGIVNARVGSVQMQHHRAGMPHRVGVGFEEDFNIVAPGCKPIDEVAVEARLQPQPGVLVAPGAAQQPAGPIDCRVEWLARRVSWCGATMRPECEVIGVDGFLRSLLTPTPTFRPTAIDPDTGIAGGRARVPQARHLAKPFRSTSDLRQGPYGLPAVCCKLGFPS
jgi:hypothetical protein